MIGHQGSKEGKSRDLHKEMICIHSLPKKGMNHRDFDMRITGIPRKSKQRMIIRASGLKSNSPGTCLRACLDFVRRGQIGAKMATWGKVTYVSQKGQNMLPIWFFWGTLSGKRGGGGFHVKRYIKLAFHQKSSSEGGGGAFFL